MEKFATEFLLGYLLIHKSFLSVFQNYTKIFLVRLAADAVGMILLEAVYPDIRESSRA